MYLYCSLKAQPVWLSLFQVCDWLYPLMYGQSPVLSCSSGVYMFPDMMSRVSGSYVGVVLSSELPIAERELFEDLLKQMTDLRIQVNAYFMQLFHTTLNRALEFLLISPSIYVVGQASLYTYLSSISAQMT